MTKFCKACHRTSEQNPLGISDTATNCARDTFPVTEVEPDALVGTTLDERWKIESCILPGTVHRIFLASDLTTNKSVLLQVLDREKLKSDAFNDFISKWRQVKHRNVLPITDNGTLKNGRDIYVVSERPEPSRTLAHLLDESGELSPQEFLNTTLQVIDGIEALKEQGILHKNVVPTHIISSPTDFGYLITLTSFSVIEEFIDDPQATEREDHLALNSPLYRGLESILASESIDSSTTVDERTVVYSLGCFMYDTLTGLPPYVAPSLTEIATRHVEEQPLSLRGAAPELNLPGLFDKLVLKALRNAPEKRQQTVAEVRQELIDAGKQSRLATTIGQTEYQTRLYTGETAGMSAITEKDIAEVQAKSDKAAAAAPEPEEEQLPLETRAELEKKIKDLRSYMYTLTGLLIAGFIGVAFLLNLEGPEEDRAPLMQKLSWESQMSQAGDAFKKKSFDAAKSGYQSAFTMAKDFGDGGSRQEKSLEGLLKVADATKDAAEIKRIHSEIVSLDAEKLSKLFESANQDAKNLTDINLTIPAGAMTKEMAEEYTDKFIAKARECMKQGQIPKAESFLRKALDVEKRWKDSSGKATDFANELARESKSGEHFANITALLEEVLAAQTGDKAKTKRMKTLLSLALVNARNNKFDDAEKSLDEALKLSQSLGGGDKAEITGIIQEYTTLVTAANQAHRAKKYSGK